MYGLTVAETTWLQWILSGVRTAAEKKEHKKESGSILAEVSHLIE